MPQITMKDLSSIIAIHEVEENARQKWDAKQRRRRNLNQWMVRLLPFGMLIMLAVFYSLSAPHTASMLERVTPFWGRFAPIGFELGILIVAALQEAGWKNAFTSRILFTLIGISIAINIGGGLEMVVTTSQSDALSDMTLQSLLEQLPVLPSAAQISLVLVLPLGIIIPIVSKFAGEVLIKLSLNKINLTTTSDEDMWLRERRKVLQQALYAEAVKLGAGAVTAGNWSQAMVTHWYREVRDADPLPQHNAAAIASASMPSEPQLNGARAEMGFGAIADSRTSGSNGIPAHFGQPEGGSEVLKVPLSADSGRTSGRTRNASEIVRAYLEQHPEDINANVRDLAERLNVGKTTVSKIQSEMRSGK